MRDRASVLVSAAFWLAAPSSSFAGPACTAGPPSRHELGVDPGPHGRGEPGVVGEVGVGVDAHLPHAELINPPLLLVLR